MKLIANAIAGVIVFLMALLIGVIVAAAYSVILTPLVLVAWNAGVVTISSASSIGLWSAYGLSMCVVILRGIFSAAPNKLPTLPTAAPTVATTSEESREEMVERLRKQYGIR